MKVLLTSAGVRSEGIHKALPRSRPGAGGGARFIRRT